MRRARKTRGKSVPFSPSLDVNAWLAENPDALITCPSQPGNLKLLPSACVKRHQAANEPKWSTIGAEPFHLFVFKMNLVACRNCAIGARLARETKVMAA
ncbi:MAG: hypothetical protein LDL11_01385 [Desulfarculus sp.]|nr:hypothetical protein [Desulfarculus sp.]